MIAEWTARFREIAICAWWIDLMLGSVFLCVAIIGGILTSLFGAKPQYKDKAA